VVKKTALNRTTFNPWWRETWSLEYKWYNPAISLKITSNKSWKKYRINSYKTAWSVSMKSRIQLLHHAYIYSAKHALFVKSKSVEFAQLAGKDSPRKIFCTCLVKTGSMSTTSKETIFRAQKSLPSWSTCANLNQLTRLWCSHSFWECWT